MAYFPYAPTFGSIYWLQDPVASVIARFNGESSDPDWVGALSEVAGLESADIRESAEELAEADGGIHGNFWLGRRPIVLTGQTFGHSTIQQRDGRLDKITRASLALRGDAELHWMPADNVGNTVANPEAAVNTSGWSPAAGLFINTGGATITRITGDGPAPTTTSAEVVTGTTGNEGAAYLLPGIFRAGVTYTASLYMRSVSGNTGIRLLLGDTGTAASASSLFTITGSWLRYSVTWTPTVNASSVVILARRDAAAASTFRISRAMVNRGAVLPPYEDGSAPEMMTWVRRQSSIKYTEAWNKQFQVPLVSQYARLYSALLHLISDVAGATIPAENRGSYASLPAFRITGPITNPVITNTTSGAGGKTVKVLAGTTIPAGQYVDIDVLSHRATRDNGSDWTGNLDFINSTWPTVESAAIYGTNTFTLTGTGTSGASQLQITWRDTWA